MIDGTVSPSPMMVTLLRQSQLSAVGNEKPRAPHSMSVGDRHKKGPDVAPGYRLKNAPVLVAA